MPLLRPLEKDDIPLLMRIMQENNDSTRFEAREQYFAGLRQKVARQKDFSILVEGEVVGTIGYRWGYDHYRITWFHVAPAHQHQGIGSEAFSRVEEMIANDAPCDIRITTGYPRAVEFYTTRGYRVEQRVPNYYPDGSDKVSLCKKIEQAVEEQKR